MNCIEYFEGKTNFSNLSHVLAQLTITFASNINTFGSLCQHLSRIAMEAFGMLNYSQYIER